MKTIKTNRKHQVLITGASTGIGYASAIYLDKIGYRVFAGVRTESDAQKLKENGSENLNPVLLDVCNPESINTTCDLISKQLGSDTFSLVNNAGLSLNGPLEILPMDDIRKLLNVNVLGLLSVIQKYLPLIRKNKGRLVNISSGHGLLAIPDKSVYAASKFAVQAISDSLRVELKPFEVSVSNVIVGKVNTSVLGKIENDRRKMLEGANPEVVREYTQLIEYFDKEVKNIPGIEALEVAKIIGDALNNRKPKAQYLIGPGAKKMKVLAGFPRKMRDKMLFNAIYKNKKCNNSAEM
ncbi:SDR family NAD(P)-dependent oxidoreductase [uncultured Draconibacterium sp.]|uniref:SDR family NAD(P)-dependent oxidoreductase n=1 Tax=uncultured Draconibacterium sp. TaxID=1573823 RepID=UPI002AA7958F|nr:SDR family NAD(P)-dependent oxidoreductase [uncultured Draconibacterium sp.]